MKLPRNFFKPLAIGAPKPLTELPVKLERTIHFVVRPRLLSRAVRQH